MAAIRNVDMVKTTCWSTVFCSHHRQTAWSRSPGFQSLLQFLSLPLGGSVVQHLQLDISCSAAAGVSLDQYPACSQSSLSCQPADVQRGENRRRLIVIWPPVCDRRVEAGGGWWRLRRAAGEFKQQVRRVHWFYFSWEPIIIIVLWQVKLSKN